MKASKARCPVCASQIKREGGEFYFACDRCGTVFKIRGCRAIIVSDGIDAVDHPSIRALREAYKEFRPNDDGD